MCSRVSFVWLLFFVFATTIEINGVSNSSRFTCTPPPPPKCDDVDAVTNTEGWGRYFDADMIQKQPQCKLLIVNAGLPRTGSTLLGSLALHAIRRTLPATFTIRPKVIATRYWREDRHSHKAKASQTKQIFPDNIDIFMTKSHEFDSELASMCDRTLVLLTSRDPAAQAVSAANGFWSENGTSCDLQRLKLASYYFYQSYLLTHLYAGQHAFEHMAKWYRYAYCWHINAHFTLRFAYEDFMRNKVPTTVAIASTIASILRLHGENTNNLDTYLTFRFPANFHSKEANPDTKGLHSHDRTDLRKMPSSQDEQLTADMVRFLPAECRDRDLWRRCLPFTYNHRTSQA